MGHEVFVANSRGPETLSDVAAETGATAVSVPEAVRGVDLIVVTIPRRIFSTCQPVCSPMPDHLVIVDTGNYYPRQRDGRIETIEAGLPESKWVAQQLGRPVIKVFKNSYAKHLLQLGRPKGTPGRIALPVSGDEDAKGVVLKLVDELGFDGVDAGGLDNSWRQQPGTPVYTEDFDAPPSHIPSPSRRRQAGSPPDWPWSISIFRRVPNRSSRPIEPVRWVKRNVRDACTLS